MNQREVRWERMFPDELEAAFEACPVAYLPYGLCEPHGPEAPPKDSRWHANWHVPDRG